MKVGDKVYISDDSEFSHQGRIDGVKIIGEITKLSEYGGFDFNVNWGNGDSNRLYKISDLVLANQVNYEIY
jgi:hypothetical protein